MSQDKTERMEYFISLLDDYIDGKLGAGQTAEIEQALKEDSFLNEVLKQHVQARANMRVAGEEELRKKFAGSFDPIPEVIEPKSNLLKILIPILLLLGLAAAAYYFLSKQDKPQERPAYATSVEEADSRLLLASVEDPSYDLLRSESDSVAAGVWEEAVRSFVSKDYSSAISKLVELEADSVFIYEHLGKISLMKGVASLKLKQYEEAINVLAKVDSGNPYFDQAEWYLALAYYYAQDHSNAQKIFERLSIDGMHFKRKQAQQYLDILIQN